MEYRRLPGSTDVSVVIFIFDPATGLPDNTVVFNTAGLALKHRREGELNASNYTLVALATPALDDPHLDYGLLLIGAGKYRLDLPDAVCAAGASGAQIWGTLTDREIIAPYIHLDGVPLLATTEQQIDNIEASFVNVGIPFTVTGTPSTTSVDVSGSQLGPTTGDHNRQLCLFTSGVDGVIGNASWVTTYTATGAGTATLAFSGDATDPDGPLRVAPSAGDTGFLIGKR